MATWEFHHEDGTTCPVFLECERSHAFIDADHPEHEGDCPAWLAVNNVYVGVHAYADACALAHRLGADAFDYGHDKSEDVSTLVYAPDTPSGYRTARLTYVSDYWKGL